ncbi:MAG TPA: glycosyltransferase [Actinomycetota bacterium]|nr:glycosyltransferase [Actinomycetota bacterium]
MTRRIALISDHASPLGLLGGVDSGGQNVYVGHIAKNLASIGYDVDVFTRRDNELLPEVAQWVNGVRIIHVPAGPPEHIRKEELLEHMPEFTSYVLRFCRRQRAPYDLLHANFFMSALVAAEVKRKLGIPFVVTFHALGRVRRLHQGNADEFPTERFAIEDRAVTEADHIIAECPQDEEDLIKLYNADPAKISIIPGGFDPAEFWPITKALARAALGLPTDERLILQLGRMVRRKGVDTVICGFARLVKRYGIKARLIVVGGDSDEPDPQVTPELGRLQRLAKKEGVSRLVTFAGRQSREALKFYFSAADVFVSTPWYEPFGITPVEAMACGTPVIGSNVGGIKFTVRDGETGYLVPPNDPDAVAERIAHLFKHPKLLTVFGQQGLRRANDLFTWQKVTSSIAALYEDVLSAREPARRDEAGLVAIMDQAFQSGQEVLEESQRLLRPWIIKAADVLSACFARGGKVLICGNGGSAADAQHFAAELIGKFKRDDRGGLPALSLSSDASVLTSWSNDVGFESVFSRQVESLGRPGDVLVGISTSGRSPNLLRAFESARVAGLETVALLGRDGGPLRQLADASIVVPSNDTQRVQEVQILIIHLLCELVEEMLFAGQSLTAVPQGSPPASFLEDPGRERPARRAAGNP